VKTLSKKINKTWGSSGCQKEVKKIFKQAAIDAEKKDKIKYKSTFKLLKVVFPKALK